MPVRGESAPAPVVPVHHPEPAGRHALDGDSRVHPRNWHVSTRLNAILLLPVLVALVMGGLQVKRSVDTWRAARDAQRVAEIVAAADAYNEALLDERDLSAAP
jgi:hypothetical protein